MSKSQAQESSISDTENICESRFECPICLAWLKDPILTSCGHRFCKICIHSWLSKEGACPVDNIKLSLETDLFPDNYTRREILHQKIICPYNNLGCTMKVSLPDIDSHIALCTYKILETNSIKYQCLFYDAGCVSQFNTREEMEEHVSQNTNSHLELLFSIYSELRHKSGSGTAGKSQETFFWDPPSKENNSNTSESSDSIQSLLKVLYEKIVILEQKNHEQDIIISNMSQQIAAHNSNINDLSLKYCNGCYIWTLTDFKSKLEFMFTDNKKMYYSPGFYTNSNGYKLCLRMNLSPHDPTYLALIVHLMKTDQDFCLEWPVQGRIAISIIHPSSAELNLKEIMFIKPDLEAFKKPTQNLNPRGFGYTEFALVEDLMTQGYIKDNKLYIKIQVVIA